jgi:hypothetical protein
MDSASRERPRAVTIVGWIWLVAAALRFLNGLLGLIVWKVGGLDRGLPFLGLQSRSLQLQVLGVEAMMRHATEILVAQVFVSGALAYAAVGLLRLKAWARTVIEAASWLGILFAAAVGAYVYAGTAHMASETPEAAAQIRMAGAGAGIFVALLGAAFFGGTIYFLRRPAARRAFEPPSAFEPS